MTLLYLPETRPTGAAGGTAAPASGFARVAFAFSHAELAPLLAIGFLVVTGFAAFEVTFAQFLHERLQLPHSGVGFLFVYVGVLAVAVQGGLVGRATRRFGERSLLFAGLVGTAAGLLLLATAHRLAGVLTILPLIALGTGFVTPSLSSLVSRSARADEQGAALGAFQGIGSLARVIGPFTAELAVGAWGVAAPPLGAAGRSCDEGVGPPREADRCHHQGGSI
jgi:predicted MFS family arabinose efflux permease